ncbi:peptidoglycan-binding protein [Acetobacterium wieringae]|uniref:peptidoglycan-binding protein n=1 Tax=Acetobacterium wieringae TaxID=52694 RepID=UPI0031598E37
MNDYVKWVQETLKVLGYDPGQLDGRDGERTAAAVLSFQQDNSLAADGLVGEATNNALLLALNERIGASLINDSLAASQNQDVLALKNFRPEEFACRCGCGLDLVMPLKHFAQELRDAFGWPLTISSGARCPPVNRDDGGVPDSCHLSGEAFDGYFAGQMNAEVMAAMADFAVARGFGVIRYPHELFCHFQVYPRNSIVYS